MNTGPTNGFMQKFMKNVKPDTTKSKANAVSTKKSRLMEAMKKKK